MTSTNTVTIKTQEAARALVDSLTPGFLFEKSAKQKIRLLHTQLTSSNTTLRKPFLQLHIVKSIVRLFAEVDCTLYSRDQLLVHIARSIHEIVLDPTLPSVSTDVIDFLFEESVATILFRIAASDKTSSSREAAYWILRTCLSLVTLHPEEAKSKIRHKEVAASFAKLIVDFRQVCDHEPYVHAVDDLDSCIFIPDFKAHTDFFGLISKFHSTNKSSENQHHNRRIIPTSFSDHQRNKLFELYKSENQARVDAENKLESVEQELRDVKQQLHLEQAKHLTTLRFLNKTGNRLYSLRRRCAASKFKILCARQSDVDRTLQMIHNAKSTLAQATSLLQLSNILQALKLRRSFVRTTFNNHDEKGIATSKKLENVISKIESVIQSQTAPFEVEHVHPLVEQIFDDEDLERNQLQHEICDLAQDFLVAYQQKVINNETQIRDKIRCKEEGQFFLRLVSDFNITVAHQKSSDEMKQIFIEKATLRLLFDEQNFRSNLLHDFIADFMELKSHITATILAQQVHAEKFSAFVADAFLNFNSDGEEFLQELIDGLRQVRDRIDRPMTFLYDLMRTHVISLEDHVIRGLFTHGFHSLSEFLKLDAVEFLKLEFNLNQRDGITKLIRAEEAKPWMDRCRQLEAELEFYKGPAGNTNDSSRTSERRQQYRHNDETSTAFDFVEDDFNKSKKGDVDDEEIISQTASSVARTG